MIIVLSHMASKELLQIDFCKVPHFCITSSEYLKTPTVSLIFQSKPRIIFNNKGCEEGKKKSIEISNVSFSNEQIYGGFCLIST